MDDVERVARAIDDADISWSSSLVCLVDGVHTYRLKLGDEVMEFTDTDEAMAVDEVHLAVGAARRKAQATAAIAAMDAWLPIEDAPRDGAEILAWGKPYRYIANWSDVWGSWVNAFDGDPPAAEFTPTHWRPLPTPPTAAGSEG